MVTFTNVVPRSGPLLMLLLVLSALVLPKPLAAQTPAAAYAISDQTTGHLLDSSNAQKKLQIGSLTKIATAMVVLDWSEATRADLGQMAAVPAFNAALAGTNSVGLQPGDQCSLRDLLYAALMQSDNVASETLAAHVGRALGPPPKTSPVTHFVGQMNALARRLRMSRTRFLNPHGLDTLERNLPYSTAEDLTRLTAYAMGKSAFRFYVSQPERKITIMTAAGEQAYLLRNTNELVGKESIDGVKTGTTRKAGECLIVSAVRPPESRQDGEKVVITPRRIHVVVLGATNRFQVASQLLGRGWQLYDQWAAAGRPVPARREK